MVVGSDDGHEKEANYGQKIELMVHRGLWAVHLDPVALGQLSLSWNCTCDVESRGMDDSDLPARFWTYCPVAGIMPA